jgi:hypothetical protein
MLVPEGRPPSRGRLTLLSLAVLSLTISAALIATGGFQTAVAGVRVSARSPLTAAAIGALFVIAWAFVAQRAHAVASDLTRAAAWVETEAHRIVLVIAALSGSIAIAFGTFSASGSDPSGYFSQAAMLARGELSYVEPLAAIAAWPDATATLAPLGWLAVSEREDPARVERVANGPTQVPTYAVGLPLLMALPHSVGGALAASLVISFSAALAIWFAARIAMQLAGGAAGVLAAVWLATMPIVLFESIQPMSDVPVTAAWLAVWWWIAKSAHPSTGRLTKKVPGTFFVLAGAVAVLIRPNLAPIALIPFVFLTMQRRWSAAALLAVFVAASGLAIGYLQWLYFGSPLRSGYGSASEIYSLANLAPNGRLYFTWLLETHGPWLLLAPLGLLVTRDALLRWMLGFAALVCLAYFVYSVFEHWSYLRFLLPAMAIAAIAVSVFVVTLTRRLPSAAQAPLLIALALLLATSQIATARDLDVFRFAARQSRALLAGRYLGSALPDNAVVIAGEQSGAVRYYSGRSIVRWDFLKPADLPLVTNELTRAGYDVWIALDDWEVPLYREKFRGSIAAALDWPPRVDAGLDARTIAWRLRDRTDFFSDRRVPTDRLR